MRCPFCYKMESKVVDSRPTDEGLTIRRLRESIHCGKRFTTYEKIEQLPLFVVKKDGRRESFDRNKILRGLVKACEKRPISLKDLETLVPVNEKHVFNSLEPDVTSHQIGQLVLEKLKKLDEVAYVRFASVYRQFKDLNTFMEELNKLLMEK